MKIKKINWHVVIFACAFFSILFMYKAQAQISDSALLALMQKTYSQLESFRADFDQELLHIESKATQNQQGFILYQCPNNLRRERLIDVT